MMEQLDPGLLEWAVGVIGALLLGERGYHYSRGDGNGSGRIAEALAILNDLRDRRLARDAVEAQVDAQTMKLLESITGALSELAAEVKEQRRDNAEILRRLP